MAETSRGCILGVRGWDKTARGVALVWTSVGAEEYEKGDEMRRSERLFAGLGVVVIVVVVVLRVCCRYIMC